MTDKARFVQWLVFRAQPGVVTKPDFAGQELESALQVCGEFGSVHGLYNLCGLRADADWMLWWSATGLDDLRQNLRRLRRTAIGRGSRLTWSAVALHQPSHPSPLVEAISQRPPSFFNPDRRPRYACVHPLVRSYDWYLLPDAERIEMLTEQTAIAVTYPAVYTDTIAAFALGDVEWITSHESDHLEDIVDAIHALRASSDRRHVREDTPTFTGSRTTCQDLAANWP